MGGCYNCGNLDKGRKKVSEQSPWCYQYGCNHRGPDKYMCGWCTSDKDLKSSYLGCSNWKPICETENTKCQTEEQMTINDWLGGTQ